MRLSDLPAVPGVRHRDVAAGSVRLHVAEAGDGPPLLLLHGWPQHWWSWRHLIPALAEQHRVLAPDLRGWGWSDAPPGDYAKATFAADMLALLDAEGIDRATVVGHDWGGYTAFLLALEHPDRVERLVALDIPPPWPGPPQLRQLALPIVGSYTFALAMPFVGQRLMTDGQGFVRRLIRGGSGPGMQWSEQELDAYAAVLREPARAAASSACYRTFLTRELPAMARGRYSPDALTVPSLLLMGGASPLHRVLDPKPSRNLREEAPEPVLELVQPFLAG